MKTYESYKESGVDYLREIPKKWIVSKFKYLAKIRNGKDQKSVLIEEGGYPVLGTGGEFGRSSEFLYNQPSVLLGRKGTVDKPMYISEPFWTVDTLFYTEIFDNTLPKYLFYLSKIIPFSRLQESSAVPSMTQDKLHNVILCRPSKKEQTQIANYLDHKTQIIDGLIEKKEQLIKKLQAQRQAIINEAVTKGLNPNAKMKDSGIEWLGEIPEHWKFNKAKRNTYMKGRIGWQGLKQEEFIDEGPYLITGMNFKDGVIRWNEVYHITKERYDEAPEIQLKEGDVLMTKDGTIGKLLFVDNLPGPASLNSHLLVLRCTDGSYIPKYLYYQLMSELFLVHVELHKTGTTFFGITQESVGKYQMLLPPVEEQTEIVKHLEDNLDRIGLLDSKTKIQIKKLKAYRQSIISEAVTGKIDVRDWQATSKN
jgi:type I restriction enzyme S subunit